MARDVEVGATRLFEVDPDSASDAEQVRAGYQGSPRWPVGPTAFPWVLGISRPALLRTPAKEIPLAESV